MKTLAGTSLQENEILSLEKNWDMGRGRGDRFKALGMSNFHTLEGVRGRKGWFQRQRQNQDATGSTCLSREKLKWEASSNSWNRAHWTGSIKSPLPPQDNMLIQPTLIKKSEFHPHILVLWLITLGPVEWSVLNLHLENSTSSGEQLSQHWDPQEATASHASVCWGCQPPRTLELPNSWECTAVY